MQEEIMIARVWKGETRKEDEGRYLGYLNQTGRKNCLATPGNNGVSIFHRIHDDKAEFVFVSLWDSYDSIRKFAGNDFKKAVYYPEDTKYLLALDPEVIHYEVD